MKYDYSLQKYEGLNTKIKCPQCEREHCFVLYVDENNNPLDKTVGRCEHINSCGYHYTPKQYFADNPDKRVDDWHKIQRPIVMPIKPNKPLCTIPFKYVEKSFTPANNLILFLCGILDRYQLDSPTIERVRQDYCIGSTNDGRAIFFQIDIHGKVRTGKIIAYNSENGHRIKDIPINWVHSILIKRNELPSDWELSQCLFGEHLLKVYPDKTVGLVEAEKTAIIMSAVCPDYVWLSVGSVQNLSAKEGSKGLQMLRVLSGRKVIIFPDADGYQKWLETAKCLPFRCVVSDIIEKNATNDDRQNKIDIADWTIRQLQETPIKTVRDTLSAEEKTLQMMIDKNPALQTLIDVFDLKIA